MSCHAARYAHHVLAESPALPLARDKNEKIIAGGNEFGHVADDEIDREQLISETAWSDIRIIIPLLFDFYHGVEILLKGFLICKDKLRDKNHKLSELLTTFDSAYSNHKIGRLLSPYIINEQLLEPLASFCAKSNISIDEYYQALKYPESMSGSAYRHTLLMYQDEAGLDFFRRLVGDVKQLQREEVALGRLMCPGA
ncbi:MAG TPA: hypothetical protein VHJ19_10720 [Gammaproteobacteria bacterium]|nr:hypothetical protein [Gammaproteobacteria bacterium]